MSKHRILRFVNAQGQRDLTAFLNSRVGQNLAESRLIVNTEPLDDLEGLAFLSSHQSHIAHPISGGSFFEHERIPFLSYPFEWPAEMLHAAGMLTLDIAEKCLGEGLGLKDATPYNVLFRAAEPVFVDLLSFEKRSSGDPIWLAYGQFTRNFTLPLLLNRHLGVPLAQIFGIRRDGIEPIEAYRLLGPIRRLLPPFLSLVTLPTWLNAFEGEELYRPRTYDDPDRAKFVAGFTLKSLRRKLRRLAPRQSESQWSTYMGTNCSYSEEQFAAKTRFVEASLEQCAASTLLDVGCNSGFFSIMAARKGARVVAIDSDPMVVGHLWNETSALKLDILPLVADISRPSPGLGWRNRECPPLLERLRASFDTVLMLALVHHLLVTERIPLPEVVDLASELCTRHAIIEYVGPGDPMFRRLTRGRDRLHQSLNQPAFEQAWMSRFDIVNSCQLPASSRVLYLLGRKA
jgi:SAM-dependent methyltransferase